jgi:hypothetical protein
MSCHITYTNNVPPQKTLLKRSTAALRSIGFSLLLEQRWPAVLRPNRPSSSRRFLVYYGGGPALGTADAGEAGKVRPDRYRSFPL